MCFTSNAASAFQQAACKSFHPEDEKERVVDVDVGFRGARQQLANKGLPALVSGIPESGYFLRLQIANLSL